MVSSQKSKDDENKIDYVSKNVTNIRLTGSQALLIDAFTEEQAKWTTQLKKISTERSYFLKLMDEIDKNKMINELEFIEAELDLGDETFLTTLLSKWFNVKSKERARYENLMKKIENSLSDYIVYKHRYDELSELYESLLANPPNPDRYEIALLGNDIFKPR